MLGVGSLAVGLRLYCMVESLRLVGECDIGRTAFGVPELVRSFK